MKRLFDQNLSPHLALLLTDLYPDSIHVRDIGLERADDQDIWNYAIDHGLTIVTKDADLHQLSFVYGHPPKVVWVREGIVQPMRSKRSCEPATMTLSYFKEMQTARFSH